MSADSSSSSGSGQKFLSVIGSKVSGSPGSGPRSGLSPDRVRRSRSLSPQSPLHNAMTRDELETEDSVMSGSLEFSKSRSRSATPSKEVVVGAEVEVEEEYSTNDGGYDEDEGEIEDEESLRGVGSDREAAAQRGSRTGSGLGTKGSAKSLSHSYNPSLASSYELPMLSRTYPNRDNRESDRDRDANTKSERNVVGQNFNDSVEEYYQDSFIEEESMREVLPLGEASNTKGEKSGRAARNLNNLSFASTQPIDDDEVVEDEVVGEVDDSVRRRGGDYFSSPDSHRTRDRDTSNQRKPVAKSVTILTHAKGKAVSEDIVEDEISDEEEEEERSKGVKVIAKTDKKEEKAVVEEVEDVTDELKEEEDSYSDQSYSREFDSSRLSADNGNGKSFLSLSILPTTLNTDADIHVEGVGSVLGGDGESRRVQSESKRMEGAKDKDENKLDAEGMRKSEGDKEKDDLCEVSADTLTDLEESISRRHKAIGDLRCKLETMHTEKSRLILLHEKRYGNLVCLAGYVWCCSALPIF